MFGKGPYKREVVEDQGVVTSFFKCGPNKIELIAPLGTDSVLHEYFKKHRSGLHHMALAVYDIQAEIDRLTNEGFHPVSQSVTQGADNRRIFFFHPKSTEGVLLESVNWRINSTPQDGLAGERTFCFNCNRWL